MNENQQVENDLINKGAAEEAVQPAIEMTQSAPKKGRNWKRLGMMFFMAVLVMVLVGCAPDDAVGFAPEAGDGICEIYVPAVQWLRIAAGMIAGISLIYLGLQRLASSILPDIGVRTGSVIGALVFGLVLAGFGEGISQGLQFATLSTFVDCDGFEGPLGVQGGG